MEKMNDPCSSVKILLKDIHRKGVDFLTDHWDAVIVIGAFVAIVAPSTRAVIGIIEVAVVTFITLKTYIDNNSIRKWELIKGIFDPFITDDLLYEFYERIKKEKSIDFKNDEKELQLLNKSLTMFDALCYFQWQGLLDDKSYEYFATELYNFALNDSVVEYVREIKDAYKLKGFPPDIIPFTGFPELVNKLRSLGDFKLTSHSHLEKIRMGMERLDN
ncbi:MAG: hypothetical protein ACLQUW_03445 [Desulfobaccales bacterium]